MNINKPTHWLTLLLVFEKVMLSKNLVTQVKWNQSIDFFLKYALVKEFMLHSTC